MSCPTETSSSLFAVGQVVRAPFCPRRRTCSTRSSSSHTNNPKQQAPVDVVVRHHRRRAVIATLNTNQQQDDDDDDDDDDSATACLLWEDEAPQQQQQCLLRLLQEANNDRATFTKKKRFLLAPSFEAAAAAEEEATVPIRELSPLLDFEVVSVDKKSQDEKESSDKSSSSSSLLSSSSVEVWKNRGDQLLRLRDAAAAVPFYEIALQLSSVLEIGCRVLFLLGQEGGGSIEVGEVDCVEEQQDGTRSVDITIPKTGQERTIDEEQIQLCVLEGDEEEQQLQERILLNLSRCFLQLAEITTIFSRRPAYLQSAYQACSLVLCINSLRQENDNLKKDSTTTRTALLLRSQAYASLGKYGYAIADMKRLLKFDPQHKEANRRLQDLERQKVEQVTNEKKLVKDICRWVQHATNDSSVSDTTCRKRESPDVVGQSPPKQNEKEKTLIFDSFIISLLLFIMGVVIAWIVQKQFP